MLELVKAGKISQATYDEIAEETPKGKLPERLTPSRKRQEKSSPTAAPPPESSYTKRRFSR